MGNNDIGGIKIVPIGEKPRPLPNADVDPMRLLPTKPEEFVLESRTDPTKPVKLRLKTSAAAAGIVEIGLVDQPPTLNTPIFTRLGATKQELSLERLHLYQKNTQALDVKPPLVVTRSGPPCGAPPR